MKILLGVGLLVIILQSISGYNEEKVEEVAKWNRVEYEFLPKPEFSSVGPYKYYIPENNNIASFGFHPASKLVVVTIGRLRPGVPTSLGAYCLNEFNFGKSPRIWGFPNYEINELHDVDFLRGTEEERGRKVWNKPGDLTRTEKYYYNNFHNKYPYLQQIPFYDKPFPIKVGPFYDLDRIISVFHVTVDEKCNRLFFIDNGQVQYNQSATYAIQKPALVVMELPANGCHSRVFPIVRRTELPDKIIEKGSYGFAHVVLDYQSESSCDDLFLYITNPLYNFLMVYDFKNNDFWTIDHQTFQPILTESSFVFDKTFEYQMPLGLYSVSLGFPNEAGDRTAYYTQKAGTAQYEVSTRVFKEKSNPVTTVEDFAIMGYRECKHQSSKTVIDYTYGVMFYAEIQTNQVRCWNIKKPLNPDNIGVVFESENFVGGIQMFIDSQGYLWFHSSEVPVIFASELPLDLTKVNNRIFRIKVSDAILGTVCEN
ncbi:L-dopachrome tautomerase yellow-f2-like [Phlebotomus argentipes]|uniref:L-dopachrome tautomerase yellow-f2-like n=1 Tax=Phlebotomus argentipes TaxID=94469 RepID=UPI0028934E82|nr:L-dopachrome tautomerase yellow-f2-like [Phlebotomus argentipes]